MSVPPLRFYNLTTGRIVVVVVVVIMWLLLLLSLLQRDTIHRYRRLTGKFYIHLDRLKPFTPSTSSHDTNIIAQPADMECFEVIRWILKINLNLGTVFK